MAGKLDEQLARIKAEIDAGDTPSPVTVRTLLSWVSAQRRGYWVVDELRRGLTEHGLRTEPNFEYVYLDALLEFLAGEIETDDEGAPEADPFDPTFRISRLPSANEGVVSVVPDASLKQVITVMLANDYSQLPVMQNERDVKGMVSWTTIGKRLALGGKPATARGCMEAHHEVSHTSSLFAVIGTIVENEYVLVRGAEASITGIVTTADLSMQFRELGEPFLLLSEIENHIRALISSAKFSKSELAAAKDPTDAEREVSSVSDLAFGEYIRLIEEPSSWAKTTLAVDRGTFIKELDNVRRIRNDVMHFDPDGIVPADLEKLRTFGRMLEDLRNLGS